MRSPLGGAASTPSARKGRLNAIWIVGSASVSPLGPAWISWKGAGAERSSAGRPSWPVGGGCGGGPLGAHASPSPRARETTGTNRGRIQGKRMEIVDGGARIVPEAPYGPKQHNLPAFRQRSEPVRRQPASARAHRCGPGPTVCGRRKKRPGCARAGGMDARKSRGPVRGDPKDKRDARRAHRTRPGSAGGACARRSPGCP